MSNLILADHEGHVVEGDYAINQADRKEANMRPGARVFPTATKHHSETSVDSRLM